MSQQQPTKITYKQAHVALLSDPELSDLTLKANDGMEIKVQRAMLASRSPVFRRMLYGDFVEASQSVIEIDYSGEVLSTLVQHIYADETSILNEENIKAKLTTAVGAEKLVQTMSSLFDASTYYALPELCEEAIEFATKMVANDPSYSTFCLALCDNSTVLKGSSLEEIAFKHIQKKPQLLLEDDAVSMLSSSRIEKILKCKSIEAYELLLFKILQAWRDAEKETIDSSCDRKRKAKELIQHISLGSIKPTELSTTVASSGLVSTDQLCEAYKQQALTAEKQHGIPCKKPRFQPPVLWQSSKELNYEFPPDQVSTELLDCEPLTPGNVYKWSVQVEELVEEESFFDIGVVSSENETCNGEYLSEEHGALVLLSNGEWHTNGRHSGSSEELCLTSGCKVHFTLDLAGRGSLRVSVDSKDAVMLDSDLPASFTNSQAGFIPAVGFSRNCSNRKCKVKLLGFESSTP